MKPAPHKPFAQMTDAEYAQWYARTGGRIRPISEAEHARRRAAAIAQWSDPERRRAHSERLRSVMARLKTEQQP
ncbi:MAG: hypothetical protein QJR02_10220 [Sinobacteraceae bacterium]|nr:hypothetical protein [Nevskiaceae bacterium]